MNTRDARCLVCRTYSTNCNVGMLVLLELILSALSLQHFSLRLTEYGSYCIDYSRNGRYLALSSSLGHSAVIDWQPKTLKSEHNVRESIHDVKLVRFR